jgi:penicillin amidase
MASGLSWQRAAHALILAGLIGRIRPPRKRLSLAARLAMIPSESPPISKEVAIHWDVHQIPFIEAESDRDLAVALGLVHAHLRLGQMEIMRRLAQGRVAEMIGPLGVDIDHALRIVNFGRAVPEMERRLAAATRDWLEGFADGINHLLSHAREMPHEFAVLGLRREPWSVRDLLTLGRLAAADVNWLIWIRFMRLRSGKSWPELWRRLAGDGTLPVPSLTGLDRALTGFTRSGSNSVVVAGGRSAHGAALIASDPHLSLVLPSLWLLAGYRSPSYHAVGLMIPGIPAIALGRNRHIAWGGTNLHAASSDFVELRDIPAAAIDERYETIRVRAGRQHRRRVRETRYGPILSDGRLLTPPAKSGAAHAVALRWVGHQPSDEIGALLALNRARDWQEFRAAFDAFAVPGQTMLYADRAGRIGRALAATLPRRAPGRDAEILSPPDEPAWQRFITARELPSLCDPEEGFIASANDRPQDAPVTVGFFFSAEDRRDRLVALLREPGTIDVARLARLQTDVLSRLSLQMRDLLVAALAASGERALRAALLSWDGRYEEDSAGALGFELLLAHTERRLHSDAEREAYVSIWTHRRLIRDDLVACDRHRLARIVASAARPSLAGLRRHRNWGGLHRLILRHSLGLLPLVGRAYRFADLPVSGGSDTVRKTAHKLTAARHAAGYGSNARHISDLADPDENYFCLVGGQDGWFGSDTFLDQLAEWRRGALIRLPLTRETVRDHALRTILLRP